VLYCIRHLTQIINTLTSNERFPAENILEGRRKLVRESTRKCRDGKWLHIRHSKMVTAARDAAVMQVCTYGVSCSTRYNTHVKPVSTLHKSHTIKTYLWYGTLHLQAFRDGKTSINIGEILAVFLRSTLRCLCLFAHSPMLLTRSTVQSCMGMGTAVKPW